MKARNKKSDQKTSIAAALHTHPMVQTQLPAQRALALQRASRASVQALWRNATHAAVFVVSLALVGAAKADELTELREQLGRGQTQAALTRIESAVARKPELARDAQYTFLRGVALMDLLRDAEALSVFEGMTQLYPELPDPWNNIAVLHVRANRLEPARLALEAALRNDPGFRSARANLGLVYLMLAIQAWESVAAIGTPEPALLKRLEAARALLAR
jgi:Flp pilus assembly protein TadD